MSARAEHLERRHRLSVADYHRMGEAGVFAPDARVELIQGDIIDMAPIGSAHATVVSDLTRRFVETVGSNVIVWCQNPIVLDERTEVQPDIALLHPRREIFRLRHPRPADVFLLVEVADSTLRYDQQVKAPLYARAGIPELWIIDVNAAALLVHHEPSQQGYARVERLTAVGFLKPAALSGLVIDLSDLL